MYFSFLAVESFNVLTPYEKVDINACYLIKLQSELRRGALPYKVFATKSKDITTKLESNIKLPQSLWRAMWPILCVCILFFVGWRIYLCRIIYRGP